MCVMRNGDVLKNVSVSGDVRQPTISELSSSTKYNVSVGAVNVIDAGVYSDDVVEGKWYFAQSENWCYNYIHVPFVGSCKYFLISYKLSSGTLSSVSISAISDTSLTIDGLSQNYTISYSNNDCPNNSYDDIIVINGTMYTLTGLEEVTNYSVTVTVTLSDGETGEDSLTATTMTAG